MAKRFQVSVSDEFYSWLSSEAEKVGIPTATMSTLLLNEARRQRESDINMQEMFDKMKCLTNEQFSSIFSNGFMSSLEKDVHVDEKEK